MEELIEITMEEMEFAVKPFCGNKKFISDTLEKKLKFCGHVHGGLIILCSVKWDKTQGENEADVVETLLEIFKSRFPDCNEENISAAKCILDHICELEECLYYERQKQI